MSKTAYECFSSQTNLIKHFLSEQLNPEIECAHSRVFLDSSLVRLSSSEKWNELFFTDKLYNHLSHKFFNDKHLSSMPRYDFHQGQSKNSLEEMFCMKSGLNSFFVIQRRAKDFIDLFTFATHAEDCSFVNKILNDIHKYEEFVETFSSKFTDVTSSDNSSPRIQLKNVNSSLKASQTLYFQLTDNASLTPREFDCLRHISYGKTAKEAAKQIGISPKTVEGHIENIKLKTGFTRRSDLVKAFFLKASTQFLVHQNV